jgi:hypothetical protein
MLPISHGQVNATGKFTWCDQLPNPIARLLNLKLADSAKSHK